MLLPKLTKLRNSDVFTKYRTTFGCRLRSSDGSLKTKKKNENQYTKQYISYNKVTRITYLHSKFKIARFTKARGESTES